VNAAARRARGYFWQAGQKCDERVAMTTRRMGVAQRGHGSSVRESEGSTLLLTGRRADGKRVNVRFRAVRESDASAEPAAGSALRLQKVSDARKFSLWRILIPFPHGHSPSFARVTIEAGDARLDIVCQDAEWWEDEAPPEQA
jgi:hypothetical protein